MSDDKWGELIDKIESKFTIIDRGREAIDDAPNAYVEFVMFESPMGKMMLERTTKPRVVGEKSLGGSKHGAGNRIEKNYSDTETVHTLEAFKEIDGEWEPFDVSGLM